MSAGNESIFRQTCRRQRARSTLAIAHERGLSGRVPIGTLVEQDGDPIFLSRVRSPDRLPRCTVDADGGGSVRLSARLICL